MNVLITGGCGLIGSSLAWLLLRAGHTVSIYDAFLSFTSPLEVNHTELLRYRMKDILGRAHVMRGDTRMGTNVMRAIVDTAPEVVVHLAAMPIASMCRAYADEAYDINVHGTLNVATTCSRTKSVRRLVFASSSFVYGHFQSDAIDEGHPARPIDTYGTSKMLGEATVRQMCDKEYAIVRPCAVYGYGDANQRVTGLAIDAAMRGRPFVLHGGGTQAIDFTYVEDAAQGFFLAATHPAAANQTFNITRGRARTLLEYVGCIKKRYPDMKVEYEGKVDPARPRRGTLKTDKARALLGYCPGWDIEEGVEAYLWDARVHGGGGS